MVKHALIVGAGSGISASFARLLAKEGAKVALSARSTEKLTDLASEAKGPLIACDASKPADVERLFATLDRDFGALDLVLYNPSARSRGPIATLDPVEVETALMVTAYGGFLVGQAAAKRMLGRGQGTILFTGASASVKGYALSAPFAMGKFALRGLAQSMARELHPKGIHVGHFIIDGMVRNAQKGTADKPGAPDSTLDPDAIAASYLDLVRQPRSAWTWEVELRPWVETF
ncbi:MAG: SDR family NAD(P)-dependent oxidoreductase [Hyphomicrobiaceae bacterium]